MKNPVLFGQAALGFAGKWVLALGSVDNETVLVIEEALEVVGDGDASLRAQLLARLAQELWFMSSPERRTKLSEESVRLARASANPHALAYALNVKHLLLGGSNRVDERVATAQEIIALSASGVRELAIEGHSWLVRDMLEAGDLSSFKEALDTHARLAEELRLPNHLLLAQIRKISRLCIEGRFAEADTLLFQLEPSDQKPEIGSQVLVSAREQGRLEQVEGLFQHMAEQFPTFRVIQFINMYIQGALARHTAQYLFDQIASKNFTDVPDDISRLLLLALSAETCATLGDVKRAPVLYDLLLPYSRLHAQCANGHGYWDPVARHLGLLSALQSHWEQAEEHFEAAIRSTTSFGAWPRLAHIQVDYAQMLLTQGGHVDSDRVQAALENAKATAQRLGLASLQKRIDETLKELTKLAVQPNPVGRTERHSYVEPTNACTSIFRRDGEYWTIVHRGKLTHLKNSRGLEHISKLLHSPGRQFHALELAADGNVSTSKLGDAGPAIDRQARDAYSARLLELRERESEAIARNDSATAEKASSEIAALSQELARSLGLHGYGRRTSSAAERARVNVTRTIRLAIARLAKVDKELGAVLSSSIRTGTFCSYESPPWIRIEWEF